MSPREKYEPSVGLRAEVEKNGETWPLVLVRDLPHAPAKVWKAITEPEHLRGFAITRCSAVIAHVSVGDGPKAWGWEIGTSILWALSYFFWRRTQSTSALQPRG